MSSNVRITFLGHSAFKIISPKGHIIYIDPFLSQNPSTPAEYKSPDKADFILLTHGHEDHVGDTLEIAKTTAATVVSTVELSGLLKADGLAEQQAAEFNKGGTLQFDDFSVTLTNANHSSSFGGRYAGEAGGLVIRFSDGPTIYHAGDTSIMPDFSLYAELYAPYISMLPIGDHYTMGPVEAAMAASMLRSKIFIPIHFGTFPVLTGSPDVFKTETEKRTGGASQVTILKPGESL
ncbi:MAG: metal-dependent hydrolase [Candidatus Cyclonatronum sp.]|uniref:metal-dependent hydrolase n=1 Tax=Cyclonatronum sp. TaxID=3024185 RepID=UPI0025BD02A1|nr:metal-dependent hydrolase [Cyclonatronum sp.]MCH8485940.1 metal-dependent hydrolase [Cyclonatronum sp.]